MQELLNNFPDFVLFGSATIFYVAVFIFIVLLFVSEVNENGWLSLISFGIFILLTSWQSNLNTFEHLITNLSLILYYILLGVPHSVLRTYFFGRKRKPKRLELLKDIDDASLDNKSRYETSLERYDKETYGALKGNVFRWWFLWPISFLTWVFSDLLRDVWDFVYDKTKKIFQTIVDAGMK